MSTIHVIEEGKKIFNTLSERLAAHFSGQKGGYRNSSIAMTLCSGRSHPWDRKDLKMEINFCRSHSEWQSRLLSGLMLKALLMCRLVLHDATLARGMFDPHPPLIWRKSTIPRVNGAHSD